VNQAMLCHFNPPEACMGSDQASPGGGLHSALMRASLIGYQNAKLIDCLELVASLKGIGNEHGSY
jgi:hypothetical protein